MDNIIGKKYNKWTVLSFSHKDKFNHPYYVCQCDCGKIKKVDLYQLKYGRSKSCSACAKIDYLKNKFLRTKTRQYTIYNSMKQRCYNKNEVHYKDYGGRGITICDEWKNDFISFYNWSIENGYKDGLTIDRIDNNGNYCPENCRWVTIVEQANNKRSNHLLEYKGRTFTIAEFCREYNLNEEKIRRRINVSKILSPELLLKENLFGLKQTRYFATIKGKTKSVMEWCRIFGLNKSTIRNRIIRYGYTPEDALTKTIREFHRNPS